MTPNPTWLTTTQAAEHANRARQIVSGGRGATVGRTAIQNWRARGHLAPAGLDARGRPLYRLGDVAKAELTTRAHALRTISAGIGST